jgi:hypothetical protein
VAVWLKLARQEVPSGLLAGVGWFLDYGQWRRNGICFFPLAGIRLLSENVGRFIVDIHKPYKL